MFRPMFLKRGNKHDDALGDKIVDLIKVVRSNPGGGLYLSDKYGKARVYVSPVIDDRSAVTMRLLDVIDLPENDLYLSYTKSCDIMRDDFRQ